MHERLLTLPDDCEVWPAHLGGSMCGGPGMDMKICSTIGFEKQHNPTLGIVEEDEFVAQSIAKLGPQPPNFQRIVAMNRGPLVTGGVEVAALYPHQVQVKRDEGALLVDVRTDLQFDDVHIEGSICIPSFSAGFGSKLAWLADHDQEIVFIGRDDADGHRAADLALAVGIRNIAGLLAGGMTNWRQERHPAGAHRARRPRGPARAPARGAGAAAARRARAHGVGGRSRAGLDSSCPGTTSRRCPRRSTPRRPIATICSGGVRAATAASLLKRAGAEQVIHVIDGGVPALARLGLELESAAPAGLAG